MPRKFIVSLILIVTLFAFGSGVVAVLILTRPPTPRVDRSRPPLVVRTVRVVPQSIVEPIVGYGTARADRDARLSAEVSGQIVELAENLRPGASVEKAQLLLRIDERKYREQVNRAESLLAADQAALARLDVEDENLDRLIQIAEKEVEIALREYRRVADLFEQDQAAKREFDLALQAYERTRRERVQLQNQKGLLPKQRAQAAAAVETRNAEVKLAELDLEHCRITAPFDGRLYQVHVEIGERVTLGQVLLALLDPDLVEVPISVPKRPVVGANCRLFIESDPSVVWTGAIKRVSPQADESTRTVSAYVEVDNTKQAQPLFSGQFVQAVIDGPVLKDVLVVPRGTVQDQRVYVYNEGRAVPRRVRIKQQLLSQTVIEGIEPDTVVITSNLDALYEGVAVRLEESEEQSIAKPAGDRPAAIGAGPSLETSLSN